MARTILHTKPELPETAETHERVSPTILALFRPITSPGHYAIDVGCGSGRFSFLIAPSLAHTIGIDRDPGSVEEAQSAAETRGADNVTFFVADADSVDYREFLTSEPYDLVTAHLCLSPAIIERSFAALRPGGRFLFTALEAEQWGETGIPSRFAFRDGELRALLEDAGFVVEYLGVETEIAEFPDPTRLAARWIEGPTAAAWLTQPRVEGLRRHVQRGGTTLTTRSHLIGRAQKRRTG